MKKKSSGSLKESFVQSIENKILSGELKIGDKLPPEREIVETMGISLTVVNAGIAELAGKGFVEVRPRQGVFVTDYIHKGTMETLVSVMRYNNGKLSPREVRSFMATRIVLERLAIETAVKDGAGSLSSETEKLMKECNSQKRSRYERAALKKLLVALGETDEKAGVTKYQMQVSYVFIEAQTTITGVEVATVTER